MVFIQTLWRYLFLCCMVTLISYEKFISGTYTTGLLIAYLMCYLFFFISFLFADMHHDGNNPIGGHMKDFKKSKHYKNPMKKKIRSEKINEVLK